MFGMSAIIVVSVKGKSGECQVSREQKGSWTRVKCQVSRDRAAKMTKKTEKRPPLSLALIFRPGKLDKACQAEANLKGMPQ
jgi:hypothetical protein